MMSLARIRSLLQIIVNDKVGAQVTSWTFVKKKKNGSNLFKKEKVWKKNDATKKERNKGERNS